MAVEQGRSFSSQSLSTGIWVAQSRSYSRSIQATVASPRSPTLFSGLTLHPATVLTTIGKQFGGINANGEQIIVRKNDDVRKHDFSTIETIAFEIPRDSEAIIQLNLLNPDEIASQEGFAAFPYKLNIFLQELRCTATIRSVADINLPDIRDEDSRTTQIVKANNMEWDSPRKELVGWIKKAGGSWIELPAVSLLNVSGFRRREYNLMRIFSRGIARGIANGDALGISIADVGNGLLTELDKVTIDGYLSYEFIIFDYS